jgi:hypothetical protein
MAKPLAVALKARAKKATPAMEPRHNFTQIRAAADLLGFLAGRDEAGRLAFMPAYITQMHAWTSKFGFCVAEQQAEEQIEICC